MRVGSYVLFLLSVGLCISQEATQQAPVLASATEDLPAAALNEQPSLFDEGLQLLADGAEALGYQKILQVVALCYCTSLRSC